MFAFYHQFAIFGGLIVLTSIYIIGGWVLSLILVLAVVWFWKFYLLGDLWKRLCTGVTLQDRRDRASVRTVKRALVPTNRNSVFHNSSNNIRQRKDRFIDNNPIRPSNENQLYNSLNFGRLPVNQSSFSDYSSTMFQLGISQANSRDGSQTSSFNPASRHPLFGEMGVLPRVHFAKNSLPVLSKQARAPVTVRIAPKSPRELFTFIFDSKERKADPCNAETVVAALREKRKRPVKGGDDMSPEIDSNKRLRRDSSASSSSSAFTPIGPPFVMNGSVSQFVPNPGHLVPCTSSQLSSNDNFVSFAFSTKRCKNNPIYSSYSSTNRMLSSEVARNLKVATKRKMDAPLSGNSQKVLKSNDSNSDSLSLTPSPLTSEKLQEMDRNSSNEHDKSDNKSDDSIKDRMNSSGKGNNGNTRHSILSFGSTAHQKAVIPAHLPTLEEHERDCLMEEKRLNRLLMAVKQVQNNQEVPLSVAVTPVFGSSSTSPPTTKMLESKNFLLSTVSIATPTTSSAENNNDLVATRQTNAAPISSFVPGTEAPSKSEDATKLSTVLLSTVTSGSTAAPGFAFGLPSSVSLSVPNSSLDVSSTNTVVFSNPSTNPSVLAFGTPTSSTTITPVSNEKTSSLKITSTSSTTGGFSFFLPPGASKNAVSASPSNTTTTSSNLGSIMTPNVIAPATSSSTVTTNPNANAVPSFLFPTLFPATSTTSSATNLPFAATSSQFQTCNTVSTGNSGSPSPAVLTSRVSEPISGFSVPAFGGLDAQNSALTTLVTSASSSEQKTVTFLAESPASLKFMPTVVSPTQPSSITTNKSEPSSMPSMFSANPVPSFGISAIQTPKEVNTTSSCNFVPSSSFALQETPGLLSSPFKSMLPVTTTNLFPIVTNSLQFRFASPLGRVTAASSTPGSQMSDTTPSFSAQPQVSPFTLGSQINTTNAFNSNNNQKSSVSSSGPFGSSNANTPSVFSTPMEQNKLSAGDTASTSESLVPKINPNPVFQFGAGSNQQNASSFGSFPAKSQPTSSSCSGFPFVLPPTPAFNFGSSQPSENSFGTGSINSSTVNPAQPFTFTAAISPFNAAQQNSLFSIGAGAKTERKTAGRRKNIRK